LEHFNLSKLVLLLQSIGLMHLGQSKVVELVNFDCYGLLIDSLSQQSKAARDLQEARFLHVVASEVELM
jgi:hypothetical protein